MNKLVHPLKPIYNKDSKILILGSFPSIKSREKNFYYANPHNRFFKVLELIYEEPINDKTEFLLKHHIALWDVIKSCEINNSSDSSIKSVEVNDIQGLINKTQITKIFINGKKAFELYQKYLEKNLKIKGVYPPSTSPANAKYKLDDLVKSYEIIKNIDSI